VLVSADLIETLQNVLPPVPGEVTGVLHAVAFVGAVYVFGWGTVRFQGSNVEVFGRRASSLEVLVGLAAVGVVVATAQWWAGPLFLLTGWQAFGLACLEAGWLLLSTADGVDLPALAMALVGVVLVALPWLG
jgi:hypothetical protein